MKIDNDTCGTDDFAEYVRRIPGLFICMGITPPDQGANAVCPTHSPGFRIDDPGLAVGIRALSRMTLLHVGNSQSHLIMSHETGRKGQSL